MLEKLKPEALKKRFAEKKQAVREEIELKRCSICKKFRQLMKRLRTVFRPEIS